MTSPSKDKEVVAADGKKEDKDLKVEVPPVPVSVEDGASRAHGLRCCTCSHSTEILGNITLIGRAVATIEPRFTTRVLRTLTTLRKKLTKPILRDVINRAFPKGCELLQLVQ